jgi:hypothetical protein
LVDEYPEVVFAKVDVDDAAVSIRKWWCQKDVLLVYICVCVCAVIIFC